MGMPPPAGPAGGILSGQVRIGRNTTGLPYGEQKKRLFMWSFPGNETCLIGGSFPMEARIRYSTVTGMTLFLALAAQACYSSRSREGADIGPDAADDSPASDAAMETPLEDGVAEDTADAVSDEAGGPSGYRLHEWGVVVVDESGASIHGPPPLYPEVMDAKPVIYLYAQEEIGPVDIGIGFASGSASDTWPRVPLGPRISWSSLTVRPGPCETTPFPISGQGGSPTDDDGFCEVCNLDVCVVDDASCIFFDGADGGEVVSKLLFYTGALPAYEPPLEASYGLQGGGDVPRGIDVEITNTSHWDIEDVWFIYRRTEGSCVGPLPCPVTSAEIALAFFDEVGSGTSFSTSLEVERCEAELDEEGNPVGGLPLPPAWLALGQDLLARLEEKGLTEGEAEAFLRSWETPFFELLGENAELYEPFYSNGAFLLYFMDRDDYENQQPLETDPPPDETVRVGMVREKLPFCERNLHYCESGDECVPVGCACRCSGCGFSYEDIVNADCTGAWYEEQGCEPAAECLAVCCAGETACCENNTCVVRLGGCTG